MARPLLTFFALTYIVAWTCWAGAAAVTGGDAGAVFLLGTFAPGLVASALTDRFEGRGATYALLSRILHGQVGVGFYVEVCRGG